MPYRRLAVALIAVIALSFAATASAKPPAGPKLTVPKADLAAAFHCPRPVENATNTPIMLVTEQTYPKKYIHLIRDPRKVNEDCA